MLKLYGYKFSQPVRSTMLLLEANKIPYSFEVCDRFKGDNLKPDFLKISPTGLVPAIVDTDGYSLSECSAVMTYIAESRKLTQWYSDSNLKNRGDIQFWMSWHHNNSRISTTQLVRAKLFSKLPGSEEKFKEGTKNLIKSAKFMESALSTRKFLAGGDHASLADLIIVTEFDQQLPEGFNLFEVKDYPHISRWIGDVSEAVGVDVYDKIFSPVKEAAAKLKLQR
jgi:glutathione S-transferase